ncbi:uncharacterized protein [Venturia canescens]|uniref:uncharacterized protein n=1 Tax=Venturia canescens TaxID=32260 RepID=UPI001C9C190C|nr:uncharacterized protein LOC122417779 [Venturia canescens]
MHILLQQSDDKKYVVRSRNRKSKLKSARVVARYKNVAILSEICKNLNYGIPQISILPTVRNTTSSSSTPETLDGLSESNKPEEIASTDNTISENVVEFVVDEKNNELNSAAYIQHLRGDSINTSQCENIGAMVTLMSEDTTETVQNVSTVEIHSSDSLVHSLPRSSKPCELDTQNFNKQRNSATLSDSAATVYLNTEINNMAPTITLLGYNLQQTAECSSQSPKSLYRDNNGNILELSSLSKSHPRSILQDVETCSLDTPDIDARHSLINISDPAKTAGLNTEPNMVQTDMESKRISKELVEDSLEPMHTDDIAHNSESPTLNESSSQRILQEFDECSLDTPAFDAQHSLINVSDPAKTAELNTELNMVQTNMESNCMSKELAEDSSEPIHTDDIPDNSELSTLNESFPQRVLRESYIQSLNTLDFDGQHGSIYCFDPAETAEFSTEIDTAQVGTQNKNILEQSMTYSSQSLDNDNIDNATFSKEQTNAENVISSSDGNDEEWLPAEVQYTMNPVLDQILLNNDDYLQSEKNLENVGEDEQIIEEESIECEGTMVDERLRRSNRRRNVILSPFPERGTSESVSLPRLSPTMTNDATEQSHDDSVTDEDYVPTEASSSSDEFLNATNNSNTSAGREKNVPTNNCIHSREKDSGVLNISGRAATGSVDDTNLSVQTSAQKKSEEKYFCMYCHKLYSKLPRHLETVHIKENDVKKFSMLKRGSKERREVIDALRNNGTFNFNTNPKFNTGELMVCRRPNPKYKRTAKDYKTCVSCLKSHSMRNIRHHYAKCRKDGIKNQRSILVLGKAIEGRLHKEASEKLRLEVFPPLREDDVVRLIRYDRLLIIWGNKLCAKYTPHYQHAMIRSRLRRMGNLVLTAKVVNPDITDCASLYDPKVYDDVVKAVRIVARYNESEGEFGAPSLGMNLGTYIKQIGAILVNEYVKSDESEKERRVEQFLKIFKVDFHIDINNVALENQRKNQRQRKIILPSEGDIRTFMQYIGSETKITYEKLETKFSYKEWFKLCELLAVGMVVFSRRRTGEISNISVDDYRNPLKLDDRTDKELYQNLSPQAKAAADRYTLISIRGKKGRQVRVLLYPQLVKGIDLILKYRETAGVPSNNKFLFGLRSRNPKKTMTIDACDAMRKHSGRCGAAFPDTLRGTKLRKNIATKCHRLNLNDNEISDLANFMGHSERIHRDIYRQPIVEREIIGISRLLEEVLNDESDDEDSGDDQALTDNNPTQSQAAHGIERSTDPSSSRHSSILNDIESPEISDTNVEINENEYIERNNKPKNANQNIQKGTKRPWTQREKSIVTKAFSKYLKEKRLPSFTEIKELQKQYSDILGHRTPAQVKAWVNNQNRATSKR